MADIQPTKTIVYKRVGKLEISCDLYLPQKPNKVPVLLWFHGGGLLQGFRGLLAPYMRRAAEKYQLAVISADYRFAPQASVAEILEDTQDSVTFVRNELHKHTEPGAIDPSRLAVSGSSAGGYLSLLAGLYCEPKPQVIVPIYPITDPLGVFFTNPQPVPMKRHLASHEELGSHLDPKAEQMANCPPLPDARMHMYVRMLADANLAKLWHVPDGAGATRYRVSRQVYEHRLPPSYILHGDSDTCVGVEQADEVVGAMVGCGLEVQYERPRGKDHFLDIAPDYENEAMFAFLKKHLSA